ncbi:MAG TPA: RNA 3'-terminal phosphate cyclase [Leptolyngbyaceae cyanobacterium]
MIEIDGSYGEGGGQVLRTSVSLSAITGEAIRIQNIRAGRPKPGLAAQHLTSVRAAATICQSELRGDKLGSQMLEFIPSSPVKAGNYTFDVSDAREGGSAGTITLVLQTILLPLALATGNSQVTLRGGTHVAFSPPFTYIEEVYLPMIGRMGVQASASLKAWGWYPKGGGEVELQVNGGHQLRGINLLERGSLQQLRGVAIVTQLPSHIPNRMALRAENFLQEEANLKAKITPLRKRGIGQGAGIFLTAEYQNNLAGFSAVGRPGLPSEKVAEMACEEFLDFHEKVAPVDVHLADQLLLPAALASENSQYRVAEISQHLTTNAWVIQKFGLAQINIDKTEKIVVVNKL